MSPTPEEINAQLAAIRHAYYASLPERCSRIENLWQALTQQDWNDQHYDEFHRLIHGIAGSAETFGLPELTVAARQLLQLIRSTPRPWRDTSAMVEQLTYFVHLLHRTTAS